MLKRIHDRKGQNTAEYAILISLVVAGIIAMQTYAQRALQGRVQAVSTLMTDVGTVNAGGDATGDWSMEAQYQYEPYYLESQYKVTRNSVEGQYIDIDQGTLETSIRTAGDNNRLREGFQSTSYDINVITGGIGEAWE